MAAVAATLRTMSVDHPQGSLPDTRPDPSPLAVLAPSAAGVATGVIGALVDAWLLNHTAGLLEAGTAPAVALVWLAASTGLVGALAAALGAAAYLLSDKHGKAISVAGALLLVVSAGMVLWSATAQL